MKKWIGLLVLSASTLLSQAQTQNVNAAKVTVRDSIWLSGKWIKNVTTDTTLSGGHNEVPSTKAVKDFIQKQQVNGGATDTTPLSNRINTKLDGIIRSNDSVYSVKNGVRSFAFKDSVGNGTGGNKVDSVQISNDSLYQYVNGTRSFKGIIASSGPDAPPVYTTNLSTAKRKGDILYNILDAATAEPVTYQKVSKWLDGSTITSSNESKYIDGILHVKYGSEYFKRVIQDGIINAAWYGVYADKDGRTHNNDTPFLNMQKAIGAGVGLAIHMTQEGTYYFAKPIVLRGAKFSLVGNPKGRVEFYNNTKGFVVFSEMDIYNVKQFGASNTFSPQGNGHGWALRAPARLHNVGANRNNGHGIEIYGDIGLSGRNFNITTNATLYNGYEMYARLSSNHNIWIAGNLGGYSGGVMNILIHNASLDAGIETYTGTWDLFYTNDGSKNGKFDEYVPIGTSTSTAISFEFGGNASFAQVLGGEVGYNARSGIRVVGGDANSIKISSIDLRLNGEWGIQDNSFLGIYVEFCMGHGNYAGHYTTTDPNAKSVYVGCYGESQIDISDNEGQMPNIFTDLTTIIGGMFENGMIGGGYYLGTGASKLNIGSIGFDGVNERQIYFAEDGNNWIIKKENAGYGKIHYTESYGGLAAYQKFAERSMPGTSWNNGFRKTGYPLYSYKDIGLNGRLLTFGENISEFRGSLALNGDVVINKLYNGKNPQGWIVSQGGGGSYTPEGLTIALTQWTDNIRIELSGISNNLETGMTLQLPTSTAMILNKFVENGKTILMVTPNGGAPAGTAIQLAAEKWRAFGTGVGTLSERPQAASLNINDNGFMWYSTDQNTLSYFNGTAWQDHATGSGGGGSYTLPIASNSTLGGIRIGSGLSVDPAGVVSVVGGSNGSGGSVAWADITGKPNDGNFILARPGYLGYQTSDLTLDGTFDFKGTLNFRGASTTIGMQLADGGVSFFPYGGGVAMFNTTDNTGESMQVGGTVKATALKATGLTGTGIRPLAADANGNVIVGSSNAGPWHTYVKESYSNSFATGTTPTIQQSFPIINNGNIFWITVKVSAVNANGDTYYQERKAALRNSNGTVTILTNTETVPKVATGDMASCNVNIVVNGSSIAIQTVGNSSSFTWQVVTIIE